ncbi:MAG: acyl-CoA dehydrogenase [Hyperthermus sp.]|nr:MAG: acyl-CoA dehydrogenase [Hyperthermus sp.]
MHLRYHDALLSDEERLFKSSVREFAERHIAPIWEKIDEAGSIPVDLIKRMGSQGLFAIPVEEEKGGVGGTVTMAAIAVEEVAYADPSVAVAVYTLLNNGWPLLLSLYGGRGGFEWLVDEIARGDSFLGIASTESHGGSDVAAVRTVAEERDGMWDINGEKTYISGVIEVMEHLPKGGGWLLVARKGARNSSPSPRDLVLILTIGRHGRERAPGIEYSRLETIGRHGISTGILRFNNHREPVEHTLGGENSFKILLQGFNIARILVAAANIGSARWALDQALEWIKERTVFGRPLASRQSVAYTYAELLAELESSRLLVLQAARLADKIYVEKDPLFKPKDLNIPSAMAKLKAPRTALKVYEEVMKWHGALSYMKESKLHRGWLGVMSYNVGAEGAENIMRYIVARDTIGKEHIRP